MTAFVICVLSVRGIACFEMLRGNRCLSFANRCRRIAATPTRVIGVATSTCADRGSSSVFFGVPAYIKLPPTLGALEQVARRGFPAKCVTWRVKEARSARSFCAFTEGVPKRDDPMPGDTSPAPVAGLSMRGSKANQQTELVGSCTKIAFFDSNLNEWALHVRGADGTGPMIRC